MRCMLHSANLPPEFWSFALIHAVKFKNMLPHASTGATPYLLYTGNHPTSGNLCIFGCCIYIWLPGDHPHKLGNHATHGIFLGYTATQKSIVYYDLNTKQIKTATHVIYDEANITVPEPDRTPASRCLIKLRYANKDHTSVHDATQCSSTNNQTNPDIAHILTYPPTSKTTASITFTSNSIITPQRATKDSVPHNYGNCYSFSQLS